MAAWEKVKDLKLPFAEREMALRDLPLVDLKMLMTFGPPPPTEDGQRMGYAIKKEAMRRELYKETVKDVVRYATLTFAALSAVASLWPLVR